MKKLLAILMLLPALAFAQDQQQENQTIQPKNEIGLSTGFATEILNDFGPVNLWLTTRLTYFHNLNRTQIGLMVEGSELEWSSGNIFAGAVLNQKFPVGKTYFYLGGTLGYYYAEDFTENFMINSPEQGYAFGLQAGYMLPLGERFLFTTELGIRSMQVWFTDYYYAPAGPTTFSWSESYYQEYTNTRFNVSLPVSMGIRYRF